MYLDKKRKRSLKQSLYGLKMHFLRFCPLIDLDFFEDSSSAADVCRFFLNNLLLRHLRRSIVATLLENSFLPKSNPKILGSLAYCPLTALVRRGNCLISPLPLARLRVPL